MKKPTRPTKLVLSTETVRTLSTANLAQVQGGNGWGNNLLASKAESCRVASKVDSCVVA